jgi:RNA polymerase sigma-70 factor (ECF subfamily)
LPGDPFEKLTMRPTSFPSLNEFNRLVLQHQDAAFTLAGYMLGSQEQAAQVVQATFKQAYREFKGPASAFSQQVLHLVAQACLDRFTPSQPSKQIEDLQTKGVGHRLLTLPAEQRLALILVDVLGLSYSDAARVFPCSIDHIRQLLAAGRCSF